MNKTSAVLAVCLIGVAAQAQVIDQLNGTAGDLGSFTTYLVNDVSAGAGRGVSFSDTSGSLAESYVGTGTSAEQALFLAPASSFSTTFAVGDTLLVDSTVGASSTTEDFGLAISDNNPIAGNAGDSYNSRAAFDWASISVRPNSSGGNIRQNTSINGTLTTGSDNLSPGFPVEGLYISWVSADVFTLGYINGSDVEVPDDTVTFTDGSATIGDEIGFYGDLRATGTSIGDFSNLSVEPTPEPTSLAMLSLGGLLGAVGLIRRKK